MSPEPDCVPDLASVLWHEGMWFEDAKGRWWGVEHTPLDDYFVNLVTGRRIRFMMPTLEMRVAALEQRLTQSDGDAHER